jgi:iron complex transport system substrate-binding protein
VGAVIDADAAPLIADLHARLEAVATALAGRPRPRVLVLEWTDPPFLPGHWVPELVRRAGGEPVSGVDGGRSVAVSWSELAGGERPDAVVVTPCGFGLDAACEQAAAVATQLPGVPLVAVDSASYVVRAGPRLVDGIEALAHALHPDAVPAPPAGRVARVA